MKLLREQSVYALRPDAWPTDAWPDAQGELLHTTAAWMLWMIYMIWIRMTIKPEAG